MLSLHTNAASLSTQNSLGSTNKALSSSMTKLGTGYRVNSAMDDAAGLQIATRLNAQTRGMQVAQKNTQNGISLLQTGEGAMAEIGNMLLRMKDLATEAANGTSSQKDRDAMQSEYDALGDEIANILKNTTFGGEHLFSNNGSIGATTKEMAGTASKTLRAAGKLGADTGISFQVGATAAETVNLATNVKGSASPAATDAYKGSLGDLMASLQKVSTHISDKFVKNDATAANNDAVATEISGGATAIITTLNDAIDKVGSFRSDLGAAANRLEHTYNNLGNMITNTEAAKGRIMDVDYATETTNMTSKQMLMQASTSMLKQSNSMSQMVASLLQ